MRDMQMLVAFVSVCVTILGLAIIGAWKGAGMDAAIMVGLVGVLGTFIPKGHTQIDNPPSKPIPTKDVEN